MATISEFNPDLPEKFSNQPRNGHHGHHESTHAYHHHGADIPITDKQREKTWGEESSREVHKVIPSGDKKPLSENADVGDALTNPPDNLANEGWGHPRREPTEKVADLKGYHDKMQAGETTTI